MTRKEICRDYTVDDRGRITSPGKFEMQPVYVPHYWGLYLEGLADRDDGKVIGFDVTSEDKREFPELGRRRRTVKLIRTDDGFVKVI